MDAEWSRFSSDMRAVLNEFADPEVRGAPFSLDAWYRSALLQVAVPRFEFEMQHVWGLFGKTRLLGRKAVDDVLAALSESVGEEAQRAREALGEALYAGLQSDIVRYGVVPEHADVVGALASLSVLESDRRLCRLLAYPLLVCTELMLAASMWSDLLGVQRSVRLSLERVWVERVSRPLALGLMGDPQLPSWFVLDLLERVLLHLPKMWIRERSLIGPVWSTAVASFRDLLMQLILLSSERWMADRPRMSMYRTWTERSVCICEWSDRSNPQHPLTRLDVLSDRVQAHIS